MKNRIYAVDFGTGMALQIWSAEGAVSKKSLVLPRVLGGKTPRDEFVLILDALLKKGDVVFESPTVGSCGAEVEDIKRLVSSSSHKLFTVSARAVKNYRKDQGLEWHKGGRYAKDGAPPPQILTLHEQQAVHVEDAQIIYILATKTPWRLRVWHLAEPANRKFTSVRPSDKRGYRDPRSDAFMANLPAFSTLPADIKDVVGVKDNYSRSLVMPFAMALEEPFLEKGAPEDRRKRFMKILGSYDHGYPSFYRHMTVVWMQKVAKALAGVTKIDEVPRAIRKNAWKTTQRQLRQLFYLSQSA